MFQCKNILRPNILGPKPNKTKPPKANQTKTKKPNPSHQTKNTKPKLLK